MGNRVYDALPLSMGTGVPQRSYSVHRAGARRGSGGNAGVRAIVHVVQRSSTGNQRALPGRRRDDVPQPAGRYARPVVGRFRRGGGAVPGRSQRPKGHVPGPGNAQLRAEVRREPVSRRRVRIFPQHGSGCTRILLSVRSGGPPERVRRQYRRADQEDKIFFFTNFSGYYYNTATAPVFLSIPTVAQTDRRFQRLADGDLRPGTYACVGAICSKQPFPGNQIPANRISPSRNRFSPTW